MNELELDKLLRAATESEKYYLEHPGSLSPKYQDMEHRQMQGKDVLYFCPAELNKYDILIRKDSRYTFVPYFVHSNINMNYIYSGSCQYVIDGQLLTLEEGDVCIFDKDVIRHKNTIGENDIILNISMTDSFFSDSLMSHAKNQSIFASFLLYAISQRTEHDQYIIFRTNRSERIIRLFQQLLMEYFDARIYKRTMLRNYLVIIITELLRLYYENPAEHLVQISSDKSDQLFDILHHIEQHYDNLTLEGLATHFGYHPKYLSSLIHKSFNKTFKQILTEQRMKVSCGMLRNSQASIQKISADVGFKNPNSFYRCFREQYGMTPDEYRKLAPFSPDE